MRNSNSVCDTIILARQIGDVGGCSRLSQNLGISKITKMFGNKRSADKCCLNKCFQMLHHLFMLYKPDKFVFKLRTQKQLSTKVFRHVFEGFSYSIYYDVSYFITIDRLIWVLPQVVYFCKKAQQRLQVHTLNRTSEGIYTQLELPLYHLVHTFLQAQQYHFNQYSHCITCLMDLPHLTQVNDCSVSVPSSSDFSLSGRRLFLLPPQDI